MKYLEAPKTLETAESPILFLAGGISSCPDWQDEMKEYLEKQQITILNPRRKNFPMKDQKAALKQIRWEFNGLRKSNAVSFWFPKETLCPITLYELGTWSALDKQIFIGVHPDYKRKQDVLIQTKLARPDVKVVFSIDDLVRQIKKWIWLWQ